MYALFDTYFKSHFYLKLTKWLRRTWSINFQRWDSTFLSIGYRCLESSDFAVNQWRQDDPGTESVNSLTTQQSDEEEETCSSLRLSESIADGNRVHLPPPRPPPSPPCPLQTNYKTRKVTLPLHWRGSSINTNA